MWSTASRWHRVSAFARQAGAAGGKVLLLVHRDGHAFYLVVTETSKEK